MPFICVKEWAFMTITLDYYKDVSVYLFGLKPLLDQFQRYAVIGLQMALWIHISRNASSKNILLAPACPIKKV